MQRNQQHEVQAMKALAEATTSRLKIDAIAHAAQLGLDEAWNAIGCLIDQGFVKRASQTADYFRITFAGYAAYASELNGGK